MTTAQPTYQYCTSGLSYHVLHANASVSRCFCDTRSIGRADNLYGLSDSPSACNVSMRCDASGDMMFATVWNGKQRIEAPMTSWTEAVAPELARRDCLYSVALVTDKCNYRCPYCCNFYPKNKDQIRPHNSELSDAAWDAYFERISNRYSQMQLNICGGEPLLWKPLARAASDIARCDKTVSLAINTNLSLQSAVAKLPSANNMRKCRISTTIHPLERSFSFENWMRNAIEMTDKGWWVRAVVIAWPSHLEWWDQHVDAIRKRGIALWLKPVGGYDMPQEFWAEVAKRNDGIWKTTEHLTSIGWCDKQKPRNCNNSFSSL